MFEGSVCAFKEDDAMARNSRKDYEILEAKRKLYNLLLNITPDDLTDSEVEIMSRLADDRDIQKILTSIIRTSRLCI